MDFEQINGLDENDKPQRFPLGQVSKKKILEKSSENHDSTNTSQNNSNKNIENESLNNGISQLNELKLEINSKNHIESAYSKSLNSSNNNTNFPFGAKFFEIHGEYNL